MQTKVKHFPVVVDDTLENGESFKQYYPPFDAAKSTCSMIVEDCFVSMELMPPVLLLQII